MRLDVQHRRPVHGIDTPDVEPVAVHLQQIHRVDGYRVGASRAACAENSGKGLDRIPLGMHFQDVSRSEVQPAGDEELIPPDLRGLRCMPAEPQ